MNTGDDKDNGAVDVDARDTSPDEANAATDAGSANGRSAGNGAKPEEAGKTEAAEKPADSPAASASTDKPTADKAAAADPTAEKPAEATTTAADKPAKPVEAEKPAETPAAEAEKPAEAAKSAEIPAAETEKPAETPAAETAKPAEAVKPAEAAAAEAEKPAEVAKPAETAKPAEAAAVEAEKPAEAAKPAETPAAEAAKPAEADASADAEKSEESSDSEKPAEAAGSAAATGDSPTDPPKSDGSKVGPIPLPQSSKAKALVAAAVVVLLIVVIGGVVWYKQSTVPDDVAFRVYGNDTTIAALKDQAATDGALYGFAPPTDGPKLDGFNRAMAKAAAVSQIIDHAAADKHIVIADRQVSDRVAQFVASAYGPGDDGRAKFVQALASQGTSEPKVLAEFKRQMTLSELITQVTSGVQVSDEELQQYFDGHQAELATPETRDLHNMVLDSKDQADQMIAQLKAGGNFEQLAQQNSLDQTTKDQGGALGVHPASDLEPQFAAAAFGAPLNGIFGPVQGSHGWNVGKVVAITPGAPAQFAQIKDQLRQYLISKKGADLFRDYLGKQIKDADVVYNKAYKPADPDGLPDPNAAAPGPDGQAGPGGAPAGGAVPAPAPGQPPR